MTDLDRAIDAVQAYASEDLRLRDRDFVEGFVRAALLALREPGEGLLAAMSYHCDEDDMESNKKKWQSAVGFILAEKQP